MKTYLDVGQVQVTDEWLTVGDERYAIANIYNTRLVQRRGPLFVRAAMKAFAIVGAGLLILVIAFAKSAPSVGSFFAVLLFPITLLVMSASILYLIRRFAMRGIRAGYAGRNTLLFETRDTNLLQAVLDALDAAQGASSREEHRIKSDREHPATPP